MLRFFKHAVNFQLSIFNFQLFLNIGVSFLCNIVVHQYAAAMLAHDDFLVHLDFALALGRNLAEAATAGIAVDGDDGQAVAGLLADALIGREVSLVDELLHLF